MVTRGHATHVAGATVGLSLIDPKKLEVRRIVVVLSNTGSQNPKRRGVDADGQIRDVDQRADRVPPRIRTVQFWMSDVGSMPGESVMRCVRRSFYGDITGVSNARRSGRQPLHDGRGKGVAPRHILRRSDCRRVVLEHGTRVATSCAPKCRSRRQPGTRNARARRSERLFAPVRAWPQCPARDRVGGGPRRR